jgi:hypothetical protein
MSQCTRSITITKNNKIKFLKKINKQKYLFFSKAESRKVKTVPVWGVGSSGREEA